MPIIKIGLPFVTLCAASNLGCTKRSGVIPFPQIRTPGGTTGKPGAHGDTRRWHAVCSKIRDAPIALQVTARPAADLSSRDPGPLASR